LDELTLGNDYTFTTKTVSSCKKLESRQYTYCTTTTTTTAAAAAAKVRKCGFV